MRETKKTEIGIIILTKYISNFVKKELTEISNGIPIGVYIGYLGFSDKFIRKFCVLINSCVSKL